MRGELLVLLMRESYDDAAFGKQERSLSAGGSIRGADSPPDSDRGR